jgi:hypothetical protein
VLRLETGERDVSEVELLREDLRKDLLVDQAHHEEDLPEAASLALLSFESLAELQRVNAPSIHEKLPDAESLAVAVEDKIEPLSRQVAQVDAEPSDRGSLLGRLIPLEFEDLRKLFWLKVAECNQKLS